tara:strand:- start:55 stop:456 length:402 start_codon:yes stop_codon:yes gene_type:complete
MESHQIYRYGYKKGTDSCGWIHSYCLDDYENDFTTEVTDFLKEFSLEIGTVEFLETISRREMLHFSQMKNKAQYIITKFCDLNRLDYVCRKRVMELDHKFALSIIEKGFFFPSNSNPSAIVMKRISNRLTNFQ